MTVQEALIWGTKELVTSESASLDAAVLLGAIIVADRADLIRYSDRSLSAHQEAEYRDAIRRRNMYEPVAYITNKKEFYGREFYVDERVLIPRPETELLIEKASLLIREKNLLRIVDVGTGSGCIVATLALEFPELKAVACDTSHDALKVAKLNLNKYGLNKRVKLFNASFDELPDPLEADLIVANLPYIPTPHMETLASSVKDFEPVSALDGGPDGFNIYRELLKSMQLRPRPKALIIEIDATQGEIAATEIKKAFPSALITVYKDLQQLDRIVSVSF